MFSKFKSTRQTLYWVADYAEDSSSFEDDPCKSFSRTNKDCIGQNVFKFLAYAAVDDRLTTIKATLFNQSLVSIHATAKEKDDLTKYVYCELVKCNYQRCRRHVVKAIFGLTFENLTFHNEISADDEGLNDPCRLADYL